MSERYIKVFGLPENLYCEGSPVVVSAGALLKDSISGKILAQLKIKNITDKVIKAAKISVMSFDTAGNPLDEKTEHEYLDLNVFRDCEFAQKVPVVLPNNSARSFSVIVTEVIFVDNSVWKYEGGEWTSLKEVRTLFGWLKDVELAKQYRIKYDTRCEYEPTEDRDLWICSCGKINPLTNDRCYNCTCSLSVLKNVDLNALNEAKDERVEKERIEAAEREELMNKRIKIGVIAGATILVLWIIISSIVSSHNAKVEKYNQAIAYIESYQVDDAIALFTELGKFRDSKAQIEKIYADVYDVAVESLNKAYFTQAVTNLEWLGEYKDSKQLLEKAKKYEKVLAVYSTEYQKERETYQKLDPEEIKTLLSGELIYKQSSAQKFTFKEDGTFTQPNSSDGTWTINENGTFTILFNKYTQINENDIRKVTDGVYAVYIAPSDSAFTEEGKEYDPTARALIIEPDSEIGKLFK